MHDPAFYTAWLGQDKNGTININNHPTFLRLEMNQLAMTMTRAPCCITRFCFAETKQTNRTHGVLQTKIWRATCSSNFLINTTTLRCQPLLYFPCGSQAYTGTYWICRACCLGCCHCCSKANVLNNHVIHIIKNTFALKLKRAQASKPWDLLQKGRGDDLFFIFNFLLNACFEKRQENGIY